MTTGTDPTALFICADDYGLHPSVDQAVQALAAAGRLSGTSCMSTAPGWPRAARALLPLRPRLSLGLHFNLTESHGGARPARTLRQVLLRSALHAHDPAALHQAWHRQLDAFEAAIGAPPDYVDGHQHVHQFPQIRDALTDVLAARYGSAAPPWVRSTIPPPGQRLNHKALLIALLGGWRARRLWQRAGLRMNRRFAGVYGFDTQDPAAYAQHMQRWLRSATDGLLLMCHPAAGNVPQDPISRQRQLEYAVLAGDEFVLLLQQLNLCVHQGPWLAPSL